MAWGDFFVTGKVGNIRIEKHRRDQLKSGERAWVQYIANEVAGTVSDDIYLNSPHGTLFLFNADQGLTLPPTGVLEVDVEISALPKKPTPPADLWIRHVRLGVTGGIISYFFDSIGLCRIKTAVASAVEGRVMLVGM